VEEETVEDVRNVEDGTERAWDARDTTPKGFVGVDSAVLCRDGARKPQGRCPAPGGVGRAVTRETLQGK
jgi:hypothetical protein